MVAAVPRRDDGEVRVRLETAAGRLLAQAREPAGDLPVGDVVRATGTIRAPKEWERAYLERLGIRRVLDARSLRLTGERRVGLTGALDALRRRAETGLGRGTSEAGAALLRGFVLGQDDRIAPRTVEEFKRSGLAHLLAVSGQNVILLALLATAVLGALGVPLRARLAWILVAIAVYVPVAGAGASIQRAGVMGAAGVVAALASRPSSRWNALLLAAGATLLVNPRACGDVGWQLSFAAVAGIILLSAPLRRMLGGAAPGLRGALAEGAALTVAATLATVPLMALHFGAVSLVSVPANLAALPAVAPVMWLGMLAAGAAQLPVLPVEPLVWVAGALAGYIAQVAAWFAEPPWASIGARIDGPVPLLGAYAGAGASLALVLRAAGRRRGLRAASGWRRMPLAAAVAALVAAAAALGGGPPDRLAAAPGLRIRFLDVGQGDAIVLEPVGAAPVLVDAGPLDAGVADRLISSGVERLSAVIATHPEADHVGGLPDVLARVPAEAYAFAARDRTTLAAARAAGAEADRVVAGDVLRVGRLQLEVLWPPRDRLLAASPGEAGGNALGLVLLAKWGRFEVLLAADAEAELAPVEPGRIELLKVAHHGSADAGLDALLERTRPDAAVISVGDENPYGHPAPETIAALEAAGVRILRTDLSGEVHAEVAGGHWTVR